MGLPIEQELPETLRAIHEFRTAKRVSTIQLDRAYRELNAVHDRILKGRLQYSEDEIYYYKAHLFSLAGDRGRALEHAAKAYDMKPSSGRYAYTVALAWAYAASDRHPVDLGFQHLTKDQKQFRGLLVQAIERASAEGIFVPKAYYYLGLYAYEGRDLEGARFYWTQLLSDAEAYEKYEYDLITFSADSYATFIHSVAPVLSQIEYQIATNGRF